MPRFVAAVNNPFVNVRRARDARVSLSADGIGERKIARGHTRRILIGLRMRPFARCSPLIRSRRRLTLLIKRNVSYVSRRRPIREIRSLVTICETGWAVSIALERGQSRYRSEEIGEWGRTNSAKRWHLFCSWDQTDGDIGTCLPNFQPGHFLKFGQFSRLIAFSYFFMYFCLPRENSWL